MRDTRTTFRLYPLFPIPFSPPVAVDHVLKFISFINTNHQNATVADPDNLHHIKTVPTQYRLPERFREHKQHQSFESSSHRFTRSIAPLVLYPPEWSTDCSAFYKYLQTLSKEYKTLPVVKEPMTSSTREPTPPSTREPTSISNTTSLFQQPCHVGYPLDTEEVRNL